MSDEHAHAYTKAVEQERLILHASELVCELLDQHGISRADLARRLDRTRGYVTQVLSGQNLTLRSLADLLGAIGYRATLGAESISSHSVPVPFHVPDAQDDRWIYFNAPGDVLTQVLGRCVRWTERARPSALEFDPDATAPVDRVSVSPNTDSDLVA